MPAPKNPNTANAVAANRRRKHDRWAEEMRESGFIVIKPEDADELKERGVVGAWLGDYIDR